MPRKSATLKSTGGEGFEFADRVAAGFLLKMLSMGFPLGSDQGHLVRLDWEVKESGWHLDDLLLRLRTRDGEGFCAISVKSNDQLNSNGFSASFAADAWDQWRHSPDNPFERGRDFLGLAVSRLASGVEKAWRAIENRRTPADRLAHTLTTPRQSNASQRKIFASLERAAAASGSNRPRETEVAELLSRIRVFVWDAAADERAIHSCRDMTVQKSTEHGLRLWKRLTGLATEGRVSGGSVSVESLVRILRSDFDLRDYPDYDASWQSLDRVSQANRDLVRDTIGLDVRFDLGEQEETLRQRLSDGKVVAVLAESGAGKSALVSRFLQSQRAPQRYLWLKPSQLSKGSQQELAQQLGLRHELATLIQNSKRSSGLLVLDGFEQFEGDALDRALELVRALFAEEVGDWRVLITCQALRWQDRQKRLLDAGVSSVREMVFSGPTFDQIRAALLLVEQKLPFARRVASEFCILTNGRRVAAGEIGQLTDEVVRAHLSV